MFDRIAFIVGEALIALRRNGFMTFAAISTVAVSLFLLGGTGYVLYRADQATKSLPGKFDIRVILKDGQTPVSVAQTAKRLRGIEGVRSVFFIPRNKAWEREKAKFDPAVTDGLENPLPDAFKVVLSNLDSSDAVVGEIRKIPAVLPGNGVQYLREEIRTLNLGLRVLQWLGAVLGGTLFLTAGILIFNAIRLAVLNRRKEVRIMELVGASPFTIRVPFLLEGLMQGVLGGAFASLLIYAANAVLQRNPTVSRLITIPDVPILGFAAILSVVGALYGFLCSVVAVNAPMKVR